MTSALLADIGGTNCRIARWENGHIRAVESVPTADFTGPVPLFNRYMRKMDGANRPTHGAFCVAGPVVGDSAGLTNAPHPDWVFSIARLTTDLGWRDLRVVNDFTALALALPHFSTHHLLPLGGRTADPSGTKAVLGPGTGLGVSGLVCDERGHWKPLASEGGHVSLATHSAQEDAVLSHLRRRFGHVSAERVLSGAGLSHLSQALGALENRDTVPEDPAVITSAALDGGDPFCQRVVALFCSFLGSVAGDLAMTLGATGGVYVGGGIAPRLAPLLPQSPFRGSFEAKGRLASYLEAIPCWLITHPDPAFPGLASLIAAPGQSV